MNAERILELIAKNRIDDLKKECYKDIGRAKAPIKSLYDARYKLSKIAEKGKGRRYRGAYVYNNQQMMTDGYFAVIFNDIYEGLANLSDDVKDLSDLNTWGPDLATYEEYNVDYSAIFAQYKVYKKTEAQDKVKVLIRIRNTYVHAEALFTACESLQNPTFFVDKNEKTTWRLYVKAENGVAVIASCNVDNLAKRHENTHIITAQAD